RADVVARAGGASVAVDGDHRHGAVRRDGDERPGGPRAAARSLEVGDECDVPAVTEDRRPAERPEAAGRQGGTGGEDERAAGPGAPPVERPALPEDDVAGVVQVEGAGAPLDQLDGPCARVEEPGRL